MISVRKPGVRATILSIVVVPILALVIVGGGSAVHLVAVSAHAKEWAAEMQRSLPEAVAMIKAIQNERALTMAYLGGDDSWKSQLPAARAQFDAALRAAITASESLGAIDSRVSENANGFAALAQQLSAFRSQADAKQWPTMDAYNFYSQLLDTIATGVRQAQDAAPDPEVGVEITKGMRLLDAAEAMSRSNALAIAMEAGSGAPAVPAAEFRRQVGYYRIELLNLGKALGEDQRAMIDGLVSGVSWRKLDAVENIVGQRAAIRETLATNRALAPVAGDGPSSLLPPTPMTDTEWQQAAVDVNSKLIDLWLLHNNRTQRLAATNAEQSWNSSMLASSGVVAISFLAMAVSVVVASRLIRRLRRLRGETLELAEDHLPRLIKLLAAGDTAAAAAGPPLLMFGTDEIGQVALAFSHAAGVAVEAAVAELRTREGVRRVLLTIAHRSQVAAHRQLEILDEAENREEDPELLRTLFRLDHLATQERRHAENLIILGGGVVRRQWQNPVRLVDVVRSGLGEALEYSRIRMSTLPDAYISGGAVADVIHLLAELLDNATSFSPQNTYVTVSGTTVGRGVVVQIDDQGVGMPTEEVSRANELLRHPPDFGLAALSVDSNLGLFVVSRLADRHKITVKLGESHYGGVRAITLLPAAVLVDLYADRSTATTAQ